MARRSPGQLATDALAVIADRRITDSSIPEDSLAALRTRAEDFAPGDTDLAWTRCTSWRAIMASTVDAVSGRRGEPVQVTGGRIEGDPANATAQLLAGWLTSRCGKNIAVEAGGRVPGASGVDSVVLQLDQKEEVGIHADRRGGATISQPYRPDATVALPDRALGEPAERGAAPAGLRRAVPGGAGGRDRRERAGRAPTRAGARVVRPGGGGQRRPAEAAPGQGRQGVTPPPPDVTVRPDAASLARAVAEELVARLAAAQATHGSASVVLTGGGIGTAVLEQVAALGDGIDWSAVDVWWGDERFVPADDDDRNEKAARRVLLDGVGVPAARVHAMPPSDGRFADPEDAAAWYAGELAAAAPEGDLPAVRRAAARHRPGGAHRLDLPGVARRARRAPGLRRPQLPQAAPDPREPRLLGHQHRRRGVAGGRRGGEGARRRRSRGAARSRSSSPPPGVHGRRATRWWLDAAAAGELPE